MGLPQHPVTLTPAQVEELNNKLSTMRHDVNNNLSLIMAALELMRYKPETAQRMLQTLAEQPPKVTKCVGEFSAEFERLLQITRT